MFTSNKFTPVSQAPSPLSSKLTNLKKKKKFAPKISVSIGSNDSNGSFDDYDKKELADIRAKLDAAQQHLTNFDGAKAANDVKNSLKSHVQELKGRHMSLSARLKRK